MKLRPQYSGLCNILQPEEIAQDFDISLSGGYSYRAKKHCKCDWNIVVCALRLLSNEYKTACE